MMFTLKSPAFQDGGKIPEKYTEGSKISPPLSWADLPKGTGSLALAITDPDVPAAFGLPRILVHWMVYNIPSSVTSLAEGVSPSGKLPSGAKELNNDTATFKLPGFYDKGYWGPFPPDAVHRYIFTLYALKAPSITIPERADYVEFVKAVLPQTITTATLIGYYGPAKSPIPTGK
jgi:Raf kinase inhibitor-like YbhB/YbcL family protein